MNQKLNEVWSSINQNCSDVQRKEFNQLVTDLYLSGDAVRDWVRTVAIASDREIPNEVNVLMSLIGQIATLQK